MCMWLVHLGKTKKHLPISSWCRNGFEDIFDIPKHFTELNKIKKSLLHRESTSGAWNSLLIPNGIRFWSLLCQQYLMVTAFSEVTITRIPENYPESYLKKLINFTTETLCQSQCQPSCIVSWKCAEKSYFYLPKAHDMNCFEDN